MRFSIITVTRNNQAVLPRAMTSLGQQSFREFEWIVLDGGPPDDTVAIARPFKGAPTQIVRRSGSTIGCQVWKGTHARNGRLMQTEMLQIRRRELSRRERVLARSSALLSHSIKVRLGPPQLGCCLVPDSGTQA